jgi:hypothetical protein
MEKDSIRLLVVINKHPNFQTQRDRKIQDRIDANGLGNGDYQATTDSEHQTPCIIRHVIRQIRFLFQFSQLTTGL